MSTGAGAQQLHGSGSLNPMIYSEDASLPTKKGDAVRGFARLFTLKRHSGGEPMYGDSDPGLLPHASPIYDLRALGVQMVEPPEHDTDPAGDAEMPAGFTFLGQFIDHDITLDTISTLTERARDSELANARTVDLDLDCVYAGGPERDPYLYNLPYLRVGEEIYSDGDHVRHDLLRTEASADTGPAGGGARALIGDPRNDENYVVAQLQAAFIAFHNKLVDLIAAEREIADVGALSDSAKGELFEAAREHTIHYYHRVIAEDFLPRLIGIDRTLDLVVNGRTFYFPDGFIDNHGKVKEPFIPIEFSVAAYRYGHSQVRQSYHLRDGGDAIPLFDPDDGAGGRRIAGFKPITDDRLIDWRYFFEVGGTRVANFNAARVIDPELPNHLHQLAMVDVVGRDDVSSLAARNLNRGRIFRLPSGQAVAEVILNALAERTLPSGQSSLSLWEVSAEEGGLRPAETPEELILAEDQLTRDTLGPIGTPLWYYILQEAREFGKRTIQTDPAPAVAEADIEDAAVPVIQAEFFKQPRSVIDEAIIMASSKQEPVYKSIQAVLLDKGAETSYLLEAADTAPGGAVTGHTLGPVGGTLVGEVFLGLIEHYRDKTSKGLDLVPEVCAGLAGGDCPLTTTVISNVGGRAFGNRYLMNNLLEDAGLGGPINPS
jgi:hypothetical protein